MGSATLNEPSRRRLKRESSADQVAAHIRRLIMSGELAQGERIRQESVAEELGVSRIPVREAIIALDREGWVELEANRGARVSGLGADDIRDHYELRGLVFGLMARRIAESIGDDDVNALIGLRRSMRAAAGIDEFAAVNDRFIGRLVRLADSPRLTAALSVTPAIIPQGYFEFVPAGRKIQEDGLAALIKALKARSPDAADAALLRMLRRQGEAVEAAFAARGIVVAS
jgi:DNA-binding GntR family transcriptional regulator